MSGKPDPPDKNNSQQKGENDRFMLHLGYIGYSVGLGQNLGDQPRPRIHGLDGHESSFPPFQLRRYQTDFAVGSAQQSVLEFHKESCQ